MTGTVFGEVAGDYQDVRPGYPDALVRAVLDYGVGAGPVVEVGAGTGKATEAFVRNGVAVRCVEADPRMAAVLAGRLPVEVDVARFEDWSPPPGGAGLLFCAQAWHWMDERRRCALAHAALAPGGAVALFSHAYLFPDPVTAATMNAAYLAHAPELGARRRPVAGEPPQENWLTVDLAGSGLFDDVRALRFVSTMEYTTVRYRRLASTYSPVRALAPDVRARVLDALAEAVDARGGVVTLRLETTLALGRRPG